MDCSYSFDCSSQPLLYPRPTHKALYSTQNQNQTPENSDNTNNINLFTETIIKIFDTLKYTCLNIYEYIRVTAIAAAAAMPPCNNEN
jgi:hypothetical protein